METNRPTPPFVKSDLLFHLICGQQTYIWASRWRQKKFQRLRLGVNYSEQEEILLNLARDMAFPANPDSPNISAVKLWQRKQEGSEVMSDRQINYWVFPSFISLTLFFHAAFFPHQLLRPLLLLQPGAMASPPPCTIQQHMWHMPAAIVVHPNGGLERRQ